MLTIQSQLKFFRENSFGYNKTNLFVIQTSDKELPEKYHSLINELKKIPGIKNISAASELPPQVHSMRYKMPKLNNPEVMVEINSFSVDYNFINTLGLELLEGRDFSLEFSSDSTGAIILNETAVAELELGHERNINNRRVIGIVKDFNYGSLHTAIAPMEFTLCRNVKYLHEIAISLDSKNLMDTIDKIKSVWNNLFPTPPIKYHFLNEKVDRLYRSEEKFSKVINMFTGFAIFVTCMGLFGLTLFITQQRTKEIGIRKVLGAKVRNIYFLVSKEFFLLLLSSMFIGLPVSLFFLNKWLGNFAYRINLGPELYLLTGALAMGILLIAISIQAIKAAVINPVESLRDE
jgi:putative ABC transport system permease protein